MSGELLLILVTAVLYVAFGLKFSGKNERLVIYRNGKPVAVSEKRVSFILPFVESAKRFYVGKSEVFLPTIKLSDFPQSSLVSCKFTYCIHDPLRAAMSSDLQKATELAVQSTLMYIISSSTFEQCLTETYYVEKQAIEVVNRQTRTWGVTVSLLTLTDFRLHREILGAIESMLTSFNFGLSSLLGNVLEQNVSSHERLNQLLDESTDKDPLFDHVLSAARGRCKQHLRFTNPLHNQTYWTQTPNRRVVHCS